VPAGNEEDTTTCNKLESGVKVDGTFQSYVLTLLAIPELNTNTPPTLTLRDSNRVQFMDEATKPLEAQSIKQ